MNNFQKEKTLVQDYFKALENANANNVDEVIAKFVSDDYLWRGVYPFHEQTGSQAVANIFWQPLLNAFTKPQRREDIFIAGNNKYADEVWVMSMGNFMGLFDNDLLGIPRTRKIANLRYAEFSCVQNGKISKTGLFIDLIGLMVQAGVNPLPPSTGAYFNYPGPRTHDGLLLDDAPPEQAETTLMLLDRMVDDLSKLNESGSMSCPPELLRETWAEDMLWYGPAGVGATYTIERYQEQHQLPFRANLKDKKFEGGWLGLPGGNVNATMQVVDVYRREGDKLKENWVLIDIPYWLSQQGLDVFDRTASILNPKD